MAAFEVDVTNQHYHVVDFQSLFLTDKPLPVRCLFGLDPDSQFGNGTAFFSVLSNDPNIAPRIWPALPTLSSTSSTSAPTMTSIVFSSVTLPANTTSATATVTSTHDLNQPNSPLSSSGHKATVAAIAIPLTIIAAAIIASACIWLHLVKRRRAAGASAALAASTGPAHLNTMQRQGGDAVNTSFLHDYSPQSDAGASPWKAQFVSELPITRHELLAVEMSDLLFEAPGQSTIK